MKDNWGYTRDFKKSKDEWSIPSEPPVPMPIILRRALFQFEAGTAHREKELFRACKKMNKRVTKKMFQVAYTRWLLSGEGFEPKPHYFIRMVYD